MTPKEKAQELIDKFFPLVEAYSSECQIDNAKRCALIAVDEIMEFLTQASEYLAFPEQIKYWQQVRKEIEAL